ncbi:serine/threonine-protein kinase [Kitasatospora sp. NPDC048365]|uniref:serine/threonine-protein kinase n=1 Tax=Kitasatospora sp. NPDC048365 TaxID=3364050 RepID=UPI00371B0B6F
MGSQDDDQQVIAGRYRLLERIGRGGMGTVWLAEDVKLARRVAVKELSVSGVPESELPTLHSRMLQEARAAAQVHHPGVITVHDVLEQDGRPWIVMELIDGQSLADVIATEGTLIPRDAARVGEQVLAALDQAHRHGVLHRDVKPANVLLERGGRVVLTDFGIAVLAGSPGLTRTGDIVGSPDYVAPERITGHRPGPESDLWSLGATLYAAVEGQSPFHRTTTMSTLQAVISEPLPEPRYAGRLTPVIEALLRKDPAERPTAEEARLLLHEVATGSTGATLPHPPTAVARPDEGEPTSTTPPTPVPPLPPPHTPPAPTPGPPPLTPATPPTPVPSPPTPPTPVSPLPAAAVPAAYGGQTPPGPPTTPPLPPSAADGGAHRRKLLIVGGAIAAVLVAGGVTFAMVGGGSDGGGEAAVVAPSSPTDTYVSPSPTPTPTPEPSTATATATSTRTVTTAPSSTAAASGSTAAPAGYRWVDDPAGFRVAVPQGWTRSENNGQIDYSPDGGVHLLRFGVTPGATKTSEEHFLELEQTVSTYPDYQRILLAADTYQGRPGAAWEFTWTDPKQGTRHAVDQAFIATSGTEYAIYLSGPESDWTSTQQRLVTVLNSFTVK